ncbi:MAG: signal peptidase II [Alphaproteobacteria bacterium]|nr:signal peptidase II [Alphaproteobacteria bacterium]
MILGLSIAAVIIILDQLSKFFIYTVLLTDTNFILYASFFNVIKAWNTGVSFSIFSDKGPLGAIALSIFAIIVVGFLTVWLYREKIRANQVALGLIIGGAIGNVVDRIRFGAVFDFLDFHVFGYHWPAFNVADSAICVGAVILIVYSIFFAKKEKA